MNTDPTFDRPEGLDINKGEGRTEAAARRSDPLELAAGPAQRVREVFEREHDRLVHILVAKAGSWAAARDIADEAFTNVLEIAGRESIGNVKAYVYKSALNQAGKIAKAAAYRRSVEHLIDGPSGQHTVLPESAAQHERRLQRLQEAMQALPARVRMAVIWRFWDDIPYEDIAVRLAKHGISVHERTVKRWIVNALEYCRQEIEREEAPPEEEQLENGGQAEHP